MALERGAAFLEIVGADPALVGTEGEDREFNLALMAMQAVLAALEARSGALLPPHVGAMAAAIGEVLGQLPPSQRGEAFLNFVEAVDAYCAETVQTFAPAGHA